MFVGELSSNETSFEYACEHGDVYTAQQILHTAPVNIVKGFTAAGRGGHIHVMSVLEKYVDIGELDLAECYTQALIQCDTVSKFRLFAHYLPRIEEPSELITAVYARNNPEIISLIHDYFTLANSSSALNGIAKSGNLVLLQSTFSDLSIFSTYTLNQAVRIAGQHNHYNIIRVLIDAGADRQAAMDGACWGGHLGLITQLHPAIIKLRYVCVSRSMELLNYALTTQPTDVNQGIFSAIKAGWTDSVDILLYLNADLRSNAEQYLLQAVKYGARDIIRLLYDLPDADYSVNVLNGCLEYVISDVNILKMLIDVGSYKGRSVPRRGANRFTYAVSIACARGYLDCVKFLIPRYVSRIPHKVLITAVQRHHVHVITYCLPYLNERQPLVNYLGNINTVMGTYLLAQFMLRSCQPTRKINEDVLIELYYYGVRNFGEYTEFISQYFSIVSSVLRLYLCGDVVKLIL